MDLTSAQYLAAAKALLGMSPDAPFTDAFIHAHVEDTCNPDFFRAALSIAFQAGQASVSAPEPQTPECPYTFSHTRHWCGYQACRDS